MNDQPTPQATRRMGPFLTIWVGQIFSLLGSELVQFALAWHLTETFGSARVLTAAMLAGFIPPVVLGPFAGALIDRWNRRLIMIVADVLVAAATAVLAVLFAVDAVQVWHIFAIMFVRGVAGTFHRTAMQASTSLMVPEEHLSRIAGFNQMLNGGLGIIAAPLGAILLKAMGVQGVLLVDIVTALIAVSPLFFIRVPQPERQITAPAAQGGLALFHDIWEGIRYIWAWPGMMILMGMAAMINFLLTPAFTLLPLLVYEHFGKGALEYSWMNVGFGVGVIAGGLSLGVWGGFKRRIYTSLLGVLGIGVGVLFMGMAPPQGYLIALIAMAFAGLMQAYANGPLMAIFQAKVAPEMQGRVFTLIGTLAQLLGPVGVAVAGPIADAFGLQVWFVLGGVMCFVMGLGSLLIPAVRDIERGSSHGLVDEAQPVEAAPLPETASAR